MNIQLNDPAVPGPGEMVLESQGSTVRSGSPQPFSGSPLLGGPGDPHHRAPSLGELHQELEAEQEAQVVRLTTVLPYQVNQRAELTPLRTASCK